MDILKAIGVIDLTLVAIYAIAIRYTVKAVVPSIALILTIVLSFLNKLGGGLHSITPHISEATNGIINKLGIASVVTGGTNAIVTTAIVSKDPTWMTISNAVAVLSIVGSTMFIIKLGVDIYFARKKDKREEVEQDRKNSL